MERENGDYVSSETLSKEGESKSLYTVNEAATQPTDNAYSTRNATIVDVNKSLKTSREECEETSDNEDSDTRRGPTRAIPEPDARSIYPITTYEINDSEDIANNLISPNEECDFNGHVEESWRHTMESRNANNRVRRDLLHRNSDTSTDTAQNTMCISARIISDGIRHSLTAPAVGNQLQAISDLDCATLKQIVEILSESHNLRSKGKVDIQKRLAHSISTEDNGIISSTEHDNLRTDLDYSGIKYLYEEKCHSEAEIPAKNTDGVAAYANINSILTRLMRRIEQDKHVATDATTRKRHTAKRECRDNELALQIMDLLIKSLGESITGDMKQRKDMSGECATKTGGERTTSMNTSNLPQRPRNELSPPAAGGMGSMIPNGENMRGPSPMNPVPNSRVNHERPHWTGNMHVTCGNRPSNRPRGRIPQYPGMNRYQGGGTQGSVTRPSGCAQCGGSTNNANSPQRQRNEFPSSTTGDPNLRVQNQRNMNRPMGQPWRNEAPNVRTNYERPAPAGNAPVPQDSNAPGSRTPQNGPPDPSRNYDGVTGVPGRRPQGHEQCGIPQTSPIPPQPMRNEFTSTRGDPRPMFQNTGNVRGPADVQGNNAAPSYDRPNYERPAMAGNMPVASPMNTPNNSRGRMPLYGRPRQGIESQARMNQGSMQNMGQREPSPNTGNITPESQNNAQIPNIRDPVPHAPRMQNPAPSAGATPQGITAPPAPGATGGAGYPIAPHLQPMQNYGGTQAHPPIPSVPTHPNTGVSPPYPLNSNAPAREDTSCWDFSLENMREFLDEDWASYYPGYVGERNKVVTGSSTNHSSSTNAPSNDAPPTNPQPPTIPQGRPNLTTNVNDRQPDSIVPRQNQDIIQNANNLPMNTGQQTNANNLPMNTGRQQINANNLPMSTGQQVNANNLPMNTGQQVNANNLPMNTGQQINADTGPPRTGNGGVAGRNNRQTSYGMPSVVDSDSQLFPTYETLNSLRSQRSQPDSFLEHKHVDDLVANEVATVELEGTETDSLDLHQDYSDSLYNSFPLYSGPRYVSEEEWQASLWHAKIASYEDFRESNYPLDEPIGSFENAYDISSQIDDDAYGGYHGKGENNPPSSKEHSSEMNTRPERQTDTTLSNPQQTVLDNARNEMTEGPDGQQREPNVPDVNDGRGELSEPTLNNNVPNQLPNEQRPYQGNGDDTTLGNNGGNGKNNLNYSVCLRMKPFCPLIAPDSWSGRYRRGPSRRQPTTVLYSDAAQNIGQAGSTPPLTNANNGMLTTVLRMKPFTPLIAPTHKRESGYNENTRASDYNAPRVTENISEFQPHSRPNDSEQPKQIRNSENLPPEKPTDSYYALRIPNEENENGGSVRKRTSAETRTRLESAENLEERDPSENRRMRSKYVYNTNKFNVKCDCVFEIQPLAGNAQSENHEDIGEGNDEERMGGTPDQRIATSFSEDRPLGRAEISDTSLPDYERNRNIHRADEIPQRGKRNRKGSEESMQNATPIERQYAPKEERTILSDSRNVENTDNVNIYDDYTEIDSKHITYPNQWLEAETLSPQESTHFPTSAAKLTDPSARLQDQNVAGLEDSLYAHCEHCNVRTIRRTSEKSRETEKSIGVPIDSTQPLPKINLVNIKPREFDRQNPNSSQPKSLIIKPRHPVCTHHPRGIPPSYHTADPQILTELA